MCNLMSRLRRTTNAMRKRLRKQRHGRPCGMYRVRGRLVAERTALINQLRALMLERGIAVPQGRCKLARYLPEILADERNGLGPRLRQLIEDARSGEASTSGSQGITMNSPNGYTTRRLPND